MSATTNPSPAAPLPASVPRRSTALGIAATFALAGMLWCLAAHSLARTWTPDPTEQAAVFDGAVGILVVGSAAWLGWRLDRYFRRWRQAVGNRPPSAETPNATEPSRIHREHGQQSPFDEALLAAIPAPVFYKDTAGRYLGCNRRFEELLGVTAEQIRGKTVHELWPDENSAHYHARDLELLAHPGEQTYEFQVRDREGRRRPVIFSKNVFLDEHGRPAGIIGAFIDITERKRAEEALGEEATRRRLLIDGSRDGIVILDSGGKVVEANRQFADLLGYTAEEIRELHVWDWDRDWDPRRVREAIRDLGPEGAHFETRHWRKDGTIVHIELSNSATEINGQKQVFCVCHDITERKMAEARLREGLLFRREAEKIARIGAWKVSPATDYLYWTEGVYEILEAPLDYRPGLEEGLRFYDAESIPVLQAALVAALRDGTPFTLEIGLTTMTGKHRWTEVRGLGRLEEGGQAFVMGTFQDITAKREAMEALAARQEIFSTIVGQAQDAIAVVDGSTGRFVEFNTSAHEGLGYTREEFTGFGVKEIQAEYEMERISAIHERIRAEGSASFETKHRHRDSSLRDVQVSIRSLRLRDRDYLASVWTDITDRKRAEARAARDRLRTEFLLELHRRAPQMQDKELYDHVLDQAVRLTGSVIGFFHQVSEDQNTIVLTTWNQGALERCTAAFQTHYPVDQAGNWVDCIREQRPIVYNDYVRSPHQRGLPAGHAEVRRFMSIPVLTEGKVRIIFGVGNRPDDYTDEDVDQLQIVANELHKIMLQRAAQNQLRQLSRAVEQSPASVVITDLDGRIEYINPRFTEISGYELQEVRGRNPRVLKSGEMPPSHYRRMWETLLGGQPWHGELHNRKKNGELHWESASISPITDPGGTITHFVAVKEDITERKRLESELRQAQKLEAVGQLAGGVAHDFNNILAAIMMHLGLLQTNPALDSDTLQSLRELESEAQRAASLTRQLLMFSRRSVLAMRPQDMNEIVANLLKMLTRLIGENIRLRFEGASLLPPVQADAGMLEQILMNLVVNARDAMPRGGRIAIGTAFLEFGAADAAAHPERREGRFVRLEVADTGIGMDDTTLKRIFEPFFTTKEAGKGTGLGLATVHGIVAQHKGWVEVESTPAVGTTFRVYFPAGETGGAAMAKPAAASPLPGGRETILVVEDEPRVRQLVGRRLRGLGYRVYEAENGQDAMQLWQAHGPEIDLLFTDMVMPEGMTGLELAERLRAAKPGLKIILSSGYSAEIVHAGVPTKAGITYLPKPYADKTLADAVRTCLEGRN